MKRTTSTDPDAMLLRRKEEPTSDYMKTGLVKTGIDWEKLLPNPRPYIGFEDPKGRPCVEIGIKWTF